MSGENNFDSGNRYVSKEEAERNIQRLMNMYSNGNNHYYIVIFPEDSTPIRVNEKTYDSFKRTLSYPKVKLGGEMRKCPCLEWRDVIKKYLSDTSKNTYIEYFDDRFNEEGIKRIDSIYRAQGIIKK